MRELNLSGNDYQIGRLNARQQFNVMRRLTPLLASSAKLLELAAQMKSFMETQATGELGDTENVDAAVKALMPLAEALRQIDDADVDYVMDTCLGCCFRKQNDSWRPMRRGSGPIMFTDLSMMDELKLTWAVISENIGGFLGGSPGQ